MLLKTKIVKCPECGATIRMSNTSEISVCQHCQTPVLIKFEDYLPSYIIKSNLKPTDSTSILISKLRHYLIANDFIAKSRIISRTLYYIPFILTTGYRCGEHIIKERDRLTNESREDTRVIQSAFKNLIPAVKLAGWGQINIEPEQILNHRERFEPLDERNRRDGIILKPEILKVPEKELHLQFLTHNENIKTEIITENCILIYYPIIRVILKYRNNIFHYSIDGINGSIIYGVAPESENNRFIPMALAAFFSAFFIGGIGKFLMSTAVGGILFLPLYFIPVFGLFILSLLFFIYIAWIFYRNYGEVVIYKEDIEINKLNLLEETAIERILKPVFSFIENSLKSQRRRFY
ncbi:MAG: hypothetical protein ACP5QK_11770 [Myxococcota bacterium]